MYNTNFMGFGESEETEEVETGFVDTSGSLNYEKEYEKLLEENNKLKKDKTDLVTVVSILSNILKGGNSND